MKLKQDEIYYIIKLHMSGAAHCKIEPSFDFLMRYVYPLLVWHLLYSRGDTKWTSNCYWWTCVLGQKLGQIR